MGYSDGNLGEIEVKISISNKPVDRKPGKSAYHRQHVIHKADVNKGSTVQITDKTYKM